MPPNNKCSGPLYEIVFMLETWLRRAGAREQVISPGRPTRRVHPGLRSAAARSRDREFAERGIDGHTDEVVTEIRAGEARYADGSTRGFDQLIAFPPYVAAVRYPALASDDRGFVATELETAARAGRDDIYVPGDAGDFPIKQAFLAFLQADAVASTSRQASRASPSASRSTR